jgi:predicted MPP superfamily phosphohydrolase
VVRRTLFFDDLPQNFDGFTITQLSDIHSGSFDDEVAVQQGIDLANAQGSDVLLFTGDIVNNVAEEIEHWQQHFAQLTAPMGVFSILGNHDYGDYIEWESKEAKAQNLQKLKDIHGKMGFDLLLNEHRTLRKGDQKITLAGVENWGKPPFPQYGDLNQALQGSAHNFIVLMSHDPSHWRAKVLDYAQKIHLTLSGHTHGMQFGIEIPGWFKFSPVKWKYPEWADLYTEKGRNLYVNRGFGFLGFPGRVGIMPEITVITLKKTVLPA